jgi:hypothetical protein
MHGLSPLPVPVRSNAEQAGWRGRKARMEFKARMLSKREVEVAHAAAVKLQAVVRMRRAKKECVCARVCMCGWVRVCERGCAKGRGGADIFCLRSLSMACTM